jgi:chromatin remodeling complex protein RSC6
LQSRDDFATIRSLRHNGAAQITNRYFDKEIIMARKPNAAFMKALTPSPQLAAVVGSKPLPRTEVTKKLWAYIKKNKLQDAKNRRNINADATLQAIFGKKTVNMFEMTKLVAKHVK